VLSIVNNLSAALFQNTFCDRVPEVPLFTQAGQITAGFINTTSVAVPARTGQLVARFCF
jgi:hypothetical protein